ncbi:MAG: hypothetical protein BWY65_02297 [Firmicutes bacterium ADurb.Bin373]|nr:MAG: hypothetical protein BWY65_02297 [Firmicutes bacterium ADurb.Bin373]
MTFKRIAKIEPRLQALYDEARQVKARGRNFCANQVWYSRFKPQLILLVGWNAENPQLRTPAAYDVAYRTIYRTLPHCRNCFCG